MSHQFTEHSMLPLEAMYALGNGDPMKCSFDFSEILSEDYYQFFNTLPNFIYKKCASITFNRRLFQAYQHSRQKNKEDRHTIAVSIASQKPKYIPYLMKILAGTLPKARELHTLCLDGLDIKNSDLETFFDAIPQSRTLKSLKIKNCRISDNNFARLLKNLSPYKMENLTFINCELTSESFEVICNFLQKKPKNSSRKWGLRRFDLTDNDFTDEEARKIIRLFSAQGRPSAEEEVFEPQTSSEHSHTGIHKSPISTNQIKERSVEIEKEYEYEYEEVEEEEESNNKEISMIADNDPEIAQKLRDNFLTTTQDIFNTTTVDGDPFVENEALHKELNALMKGLTAIQYDEDTFVLGAGAPDFLAQLKELERLHPQVQ